MTTMPAMRIAMATLAYNTPDLVAAMRDQIPGVLVVDNGSDPPIPGAEIRLESNLYFSGGWNAAMRQLRDYDYVWMLNSDVTGVTQPMGVDLAETLDRLGPDAAACSPAYNSPWDWMELVRGGGTREATRWLDMAGVMMSRRAWNLVGEFDDRVFLGYGADVDWCKRARLLGQRLYVVHDCWFHHIGGETVRRTGHHEQADAGVAWELMKAKWGVKD